MLYYNVFHCSVTPLGKTQQFLFSFVCTFLLLIYIVLDKLIKVGRPSPITNIFDLVYNKSIKTFTFDSLCLPPKICCAWQRRILTLKGVSNELCDMHTCSVKHKNKPPANRLTRGSDRPVQNTSSEQSIWRETDALYTIRHNQLTVFADALLLRMTS